MNLAHGPSEARTKTSLQTIVFAYDATHDVVIATPHWKVETLGDVSTWSGQYESYLAGFGRKVDLVMVLDDFEIAKDVAILWGHRRALILERFTRFSIRVRSSPRVRLFVNTSGVRYDAPTAESPSVEHALKTLAALRASDSGAWQKR